jgi:hypothetical protein
LEGWSPVRSTLCQHVQPIIFGSLEEEFIGFVQILDEKCRVLNYVCTVALGMRKQCLPRGVDARLSLNGRGCHAPILRWTQTSAKPAASAPKVENENHTAAYNTEHRCSIPVAVISIVAAAIRIGWGWRFHAVACTVTCRGVLATKTAAALGARWTTPITTAHGIHIIGTARLSAVAACSFSGAGASITREILCLLNVQVSRSC